MKVSEWLRQYQISGAVPESPKGEEIIAFWAGWLIGASSRSQSIERLSDPRNLEMAIKVAEFIEKCAK
jgi:hypothetical protein